MFGKGVICDRCGKEIDKTKNWGVCESCLDDLCAECFGTSNDHGECEKCATVWETKG